MININCSTKNKIFTYFIVALTLSVFTMTTQITNAQSIAPDSSLVKKIIDRYIKYDNYNFDAQIKSIRIANPDWELTYPVIELNRNQELLLTFDYLNDEPAQFTYKIYHLNSSWSGHDAMFSEYARGFELNTINDYESSYSALESYHHYELQFPNEDIQLTISGNYLIEVFKNNEPTPAFRRRFVIYESLTSIQGQVQRDMSSNYGSTSHKIPFSVNLLGMHVNDPYSEIQVKILPNNNWHRAHDKFQPLYVKGDKLIYESKDENIFDAGNEYRTIIINDLDYQAIMVESTQQINENYHIKLRPDASRRYLKYQSHEDLNGSFVIEKSNSMTPQLDADYVYVYFTLQVERPILSGQLFVYGGMTDYTFSKNNIMSYNPSKKQYELRLKLKQGFYDYQYIVTDAYNNYNPDFTEMEGSHWETQNEYLIYVYYKDFLNGYHRVIGFKTIRTLF